MEAVKSLIKELYKRGGGVSKARTRSKFSLATAGGSVLGVTILMKYVARTVKNLLPGFTHRFSFLDTAKSVVLPFNSISINDKKA